MGERVVASLRALVKSLVDVGPFLHPLTTCEHMMVSQLAEPPPVRQAAPAAGGAPASQEAKSDQPVRASESTER